MEIFSKMVKGGIIGAGIFTLYTLIITPFFYGKCGDMGCALDWLVGLIAFPTGFVITPMILYIFNAPTAFTTVAPHEALHKYAVTSYFIGGIIQYFLIGSLIGLIINIVKKK